MKRRFLLLLTLLLSLSATAQETYRFAGRDTCALYLDIYRPAPGSQTTLDGIEKPAILYVFGGGFITGQRNDPYILPWVKLLQEDGYSVVTIDYRLGMKGYPVKKGLSGAYKASDRFLLAQTVGVEDVFDAISYLRERRDSLGIDPDNLVISGSSAGAIISLAAMHAVSNGQAQGQPRDFRFKGVISFAGAIISTSGAPTFRNPPCPVLLFHGTADQAVAYDHFGAFGRGIWGSSYLASYFKKRGWNYNIWRFDGFTHGVAAYMKELWTIEKDFLENDVVRGIGRNVDALVSDPSLPRWKPIALDDIY